MIYDTITQACNLFAPIRFDSNRDVLPIDIQFTYLYTTREGFLRKNIVAVSFIQNCAIHQYS